MEIIVIARYGGGRTARLSNVAQLAYLNVYVTNETLQLYLCNVAFTYTLRTYLTLMWLIGDVRGVVMCIHVLEINCLLNSVFSVFLIIFDKIRIITPCIISNFAYAFIENIFIF